MNRSTPPPDGARISIRAPFLSSARLAIGLPAAVAALIYLPSLANGFAFDDVPIVEANPAAHGIGHFPAPLLQPYWSQYHQAYRPVTQLSFAIDWTIGGGSPLPYHATNVLLHALATALVAAVALRWLPPLAAGAAALVFAIHPVHVEAVANVVGRSELLSAAALLGMLLVVTGARRGSERWLAIAALAALATGAKESGAVAPALVWVAAGLSRRPMWRDLAAASTGVALLFVARLAILGSVIGANPHPAFAVASAGERWLLALASLARVGGLLAAPQEPGIDYSPSLAELAHPPWALAAAGAAFVGLALAAGVRHFRAPGLLTGAILLTGLPLVLVSNLFFPSGVIIAERTLYLPSVGAALLLGMGAAALRPRPGAAAAAAGLWAIPALWLQQREIPVWRSSERVYETILARMPSSYKGYFFVGNLRVDAGRDAEASRLYARGIALFDGDPQLLYAAGAHAARTGDTARALAWLARALELDARNRRARTMLARMRLAGGDAAGAARLLRAGLAREPDQREWRRLLERAERRQD